MHERTTLYKVGLRGFFPPVHSKHLKAVIWKLDQAKLSYISSNCHEHQQIFRIVSCILSVLAGDEQDSKSK